MSEQAPIDLAAAATASARSGASSLVSTVQQYAQNRNVQIGLAVGVGAFAFYWFYCRPIVAARKARELAAVEQVAALPAGVEGQQFADDDQGQTIPDAMEQQSNSGGEYENPEIGGYEPYAQ
jgi:hypothetical protein